MGTGNGVFARRCCCPSTRSACEEWLRCTIADRKVFMIKPRLSFWQIWNMSFGFLGIQFGWGLQMANMSAIYEYLGAKESELAVLWLAAPLTGLLVQPLIGYASDRTWG